MPRILTTLCLIAITGCASDDPPGSFAITTPDHNTIGLPYAPLVSWRASEGATSYVVEISTSVGSGWNPGYYSPELSADTLEITIPETELPSLPALSPWYSATVRAFNDAGDTTTFPVLFHAGDYPVFVSGETPFEWRSSTCAAGGTNDTGVSGSIMLVETTTNCAGVQTLYFTRPSIDLTSYAAGHISFRVESNTAGQTINFRVQDANAVSSTNTSLTTYGFDPGKTAVLQPISIPVASLASGLSLADMERVFHVELTCPTVNCFTTFSNIEWTLR